jgi:hypothetical protein
MTAATLLTRLYPPAVRDRWGNDIGREVTESGIRSWPDTITGAARLWLQPSDWPETYPGQTRRVLVAALFTVAAVATLVLRATQPTATLTADIHHPVTSLWLAPLLLGIGLATPLPPLRWTALLHLTAEAARRLAAPAAAVLVMVLIARSGVTGNLGRWGHAAMVAYYWATLALTALSMCSLVARVARDGIAPTTRRLRAALLLIGTGLALAAGQSLLTVVGIAHHGDYLAIALALGTLGAGTIRAGQSLHAATV